MSETNTTIQAAPETAQPPAAPPASSLQQTVDTDLQAAALAKAKAIGSDLQSHVETLGASEDLSKAQSLISEALQWIESHFKSAFAAVEKAI